MNQLDGKSRMCACCNRTAVNLLCGSAETACLVVSTLEIEYRQWEKGPRGELVGMHC